MWNVERKRARCCRAEVRDADCCIGIEWKQRRIKGFLCLSTRLGLAVMAIERWGSERRQGMAGPSNWCTLRLQPYDICVGPPRSSKRGSQSVLYLQTPPLTRHHVRHAAHQPRRHQDRGLLRECAQDGRGEPFPRPGFIFDALEINRAPQNFLALCASAYYDGSLFHRLIPGFMIQTGAPPSQPKGGVSIWDAPFEDEIRPTLRHNARGIVSMANKGPATNGSQFFICFDKAPHLDGKNTVFGHVLGDESLATMATMEKVGVDKKSRPKDPIRIESVTLHANPLAG